MPDRFIHQTSALFQHFWRDHPQLRFGEAALAFIETMNGGELSTRYLIERLQEHRSAFTRLRHTVDAFEQQFLDIMLETATLLLTRASIAGHDPHSMVAIGDRANRKSR